MPTFLQAVELPQRCFLQEVLLWVAFQRLPIATYDHEGVELRESESREINNYSAEHPDIGEAFLDGSESS